MDYSFVQVIREYWLLIPHGRISYVAGKDIISNYHTPMLSYGGKRIADLYWDRVLSGVLLSNLCK